MRFVLFRIDALGLIVYSHKVMLAVALLFALVVGPRWAQRLTGLPARLTFRVTVFLAIAALVGGHLHYAINYPEFAAARMPWEGLHAGGAILGLLLAAPVIFAAFRVHPGLMADAIMPASGVSVFLARMGCFLFGCCFGVRCDHFWCVPFPPGSLPSIIHAQRGLSTYESWSLPVHPLQLYFGLVGLAITAIALWFLPRKRYHGQ